MKTTVLTVLVLSLPHAYVFWRASTVPAVQRRITRRWRIAIAIALWVLFYVGGGYFAGSIFIHWMACLFLISLALLLVDIATGFGFFLPRYASKLRGLALVAGLLMSVTAIVQGLRPPVVAEYEVHIKDLPAELDGAVLAAIADTHVGPLIGPDWLEARVQQLLQMRPDMIVLLGDIFGSQN